MEDEALHAIADVGAGTEYANGEAAVPSLDTLDTLDSTPYLELPAGAQVKPAVGVIKADGQPKGVPFRVSLVAGYR